MSDLNDEDVNKLFNNFSQAIRDNDVDKLHDLSKEETQEEKDLPEEETPDVANEPDEDQPQEEDEQEGDSPQETADNEGGEEEVPEKKSELDQLKEQLATLKKENHSLKSQAGRMPHVQKRLRELDKKLEELTKQSSSPSSSTASTRIQPELDAILKSVKDSDPELAEAIAKAAMRSAELASEESRTKEIDTIRFLRQQESSAYEQAEAERLLEMYPNAPQVFASKHWSDWMKSQSEGIQNLANSNNADEVSFAMEKYARDMLAQYPELAGKASQAAKSEAPEGAQTQAKKIEEQRRKRKETSANVSSPNAPGKVSVPDDPEALFRKFSKQFEKERTGS